MPENANATAAVDDVLAQLGFDVNATEPKHDQHDDHHGKEDKKEKKSKHATPVENSYEGMTIKPFAVAFGDKRSWIRASRDSMQFDSATLWRMGNKERKRQNKSIDGMLRALGDNQRRLVERVIEEKKLHEDNPDATWEPFSVRKVEKEYQKNWFVAERVTTGLELIIRRKDKYWDSVNDKPTGTATNPATYLGDVIDLTKPIDRDWVVIGEKKKDKPKKEHVVDVVPVPAPPPINPDPLKYKWNGQFWEEKTEEEVVQDRAARNNELYFRELDDARRRKHVAKALIQEEEQNKAQLKAHAERLAAEALRAQNMLRQEQGLPPLAALPGLVDAPQATRGQGVNGGNPFQPQNVHPDNFRPAQNVGYEPRRNEFDPRDARRRPPSRAGSLHRYTSDDDDEYDEYEDSSNDDPEQFRRPSRGYAFPPDQRRRRDAWDVPRRMYDEDRFARRRGGLPDDYPTQRMITNYPQATEDAPYRRRRATYVEPVAREIRYRTSTEVLPGGTRRYRGDDYGI